MKRVLVVFTGGTIGSESDENTIKASKGTAKVLLSIYKESIGEDVGFTAITPLNILSENLKPEDWATLIHSIEEANYRSFDGVIITHGTDTLAYSATLLALYFHAIKIPMLLVSSHLPLEDKLSNGFVNFTAAVDFIKENIASGLFVSYKNPSETFTSIFLGTRIAMSTQLSSHFESIDGIYAKYENNHFHGQTNIQIKESTFNLKASFTKNILYIKPYPGINYHHYNLDKVDAVLHDLYHSGTANFEILHDFIQECFEMNIPIFLAPLRKEQNVYESTALLQQDQATFIYNISIEATLAKLYIAFGSFDTLEEIHSFLKTPLNNEFLE